MRQASTAHRITRRRRKKYGGERGIQGGGRICPQGVGEGVLTLELRSQSVPEPQTDATFGQGSK
eukprot:1254195-Rhodomonas_salina.2